MAQPVKKTVKPAKPATRAKSPQVTGLRRLIRATNTTDKKSMRKVKRETRGQQSRTQAVQKLSKVGKDFSGLPVILWPVAIGVAWVWMRNTLEKERSKRDLTEARQFIEDLRGKRR